MCERDGTSEDTKKLLFILDATTIVRLSQKKRVLIFQTLTEIVTGKNSERRGFPLKQLRRRKK